MYHEKASQGNRRLFTGSGGGAGRNATQGSISSLTSNGFAMTTSGGKSVSVTTGPNTTVSITVTGASSSGLAVGRNGGRPGGQAGAPSSGGNA